MMFKLFKKYLGINETERKILNWTFLWLIYAFILVRLIPLKWFSSILGEFNKKINIDLSEDQYKLIVYQTRSIRRLKKRLPWAIKCFEEAIAAKKGLEKHNIKTTLYLGVSKNKEKNLIAHAWLKSGEIFISGKKGHEKHAVVGFYT